MSMGFMVDEQNRKPLETILPPEKCADFMWMGGYMNGIQMYKNINTGRYLNINSDGQCVIYNALNSHFVAVESAEAIRIAYSRSHPTTNIAATKNVRR